MLPRILEPEVMDTAEEARDYDAMDHAAVNRAFAADFLSLLQGSPLAARLAGAGDPLRILDVGTGTALIPIEICRTFRLDGATLPVRITAIDLAGEMLKLAERNVRDAGLADRVQLEPADAKRLPYGDGSFDAVISNSIVHHIPEPVDVLREMRRVLRPGGVSLVRDLLRPPDAVTLERLVSTHAGGETAHAQQMFRDSLHAALTIDEVRRLLEDVGFPPEWVRRTTDRHWTAAGVV
ncbi:MAG: class I SAM-dependent methyltransferase [Planctomycetales bacterium]